MFEVPVRTGEASGHFVVVCDPVRVVPDRLGIIRYTFVVESALSGVGSNARAIDTLRHPIVSGGHGINAVPRNIGSGPFSIEGV